MAFPSYPFRAHVKRFKNCRGRVEEPGTAPIKGVLSVDRDPPQTHVFSRTELDDAWPAGPSLFKPAPLLHSHCPAFVLADLLLPQLGLAAPWAAPFTWQGT